MKHGESSVFPPPSLFHNMHNQVTLCRKTATHVYWKIWCFIYIQQTNEHGFIVVFSSVTMKEDFDMKMEIRWGYSLFCKAGHTLFVFCISRNAPWNMKHLLYTFPISCEFRVLLMPRKNKLRNYVAFHTNADPGIKCCEMWKAKRSVKCEESDAQHPIIHFSFFTFRRCLLHIPR